MNIYARQAQIWMYATEMRNDTDGRQIHDLARTVVAQAEQIAALVSALQRTEANFCTAVNGNPVRDMTETLADNAAALAAPLSQCPHGVPVESNGVTVRYCPRCPGDAPDGYFDA